MPAITASAPGKVILFGEHAVVYGQPAIAVPVNEVRAQAIISPLIQGPAGAIRIEAPAVGLSSAFADLAEDHPLAVALALTLQALNVEKPPAFKLRIVSSIPVAAGLGSGAAVSVAVVRAVSAFLGQPLPDEQVSAIAFEVEKLHHGAPSGIDNSVVTYKLPVYFVKSQPLETLKVAYPFTLVIGDTGVASPTREAVADVRRGWEADTDCYEALFAKIGELAQSARRAIEGGDPASLGPMMNENHALLQELAVSSAELDALVAAAREAGALGVKLSGGGRGGNMVALADELTADKVVVALQSAGATNTIITTVQ